MPTGQREAGKVSHPESGVPVARDAHPHHLGGIRLQTGCPPRADPQQNLEKARARDSPGIGRGFQAPPPHPKVRAVSRAGNPARAPKRGAAAGKSGEKLLLFFSFLALALPPPSPTPRRSPPRGAPPPPPGAPPPRRRRPTAGRPSLAFVGSPIEGEDGPPGPRLRLHNSIKGGACGRGLRSLKPGTLAFAFLLPGLLRGLCTIPSALLGKDLLRFEGLGRALVLRGKALGFLTADFAFSPAGLLWSVFHCGL